MRPARLAVAFGIALFGAAAGACRAAGQERSPLGDARGLLERGLFDQADSAFLRLAKSPDPDRRLAAASLAELRLRRGRRSEALALARGVIREADAANRLEARDWLAVGVAQRILGESDPQRFKDALDALDRAVAADSGLLEAHVRLGDLFLEKYQAPEARDAYGHALRRDSGHARARLGMARLLLFEGSSAVGPAAVAARNVRPELSGAHALLARLALDAEQYDSATAHATRAIALDSLDLEAWGLLAASAVLRDDTASVAALGASVRKLHGRPALFFATIAEALARNRRYADAARWARAGVDADPDEHRALGILAMNELRLGRIDSGRAHLETAFQRDPYHLWHKNTLDLLDALARYRTVSSARITLVAPADQAEALGLELLPMLETAYDRFAERYEYRPSAPIRLEVYEHHADFSVRTVGLPGLGALGVSFGTVLAMDAPSARPGGAFNWGSTAWHELAHSFTLGASGHRVPRWLSEGLSVVEERRARPGWGAHPTAEFLVAYQDRRLPPLSRLNDGFVRPRLPQDIGHAYYLASLACEWMEATWGIDAIRRLLRGYGEGHGTSELLTRVLQVRPEELDRRFDAYVRQRFAKGLAAVGSAATRQSGGDFAGHVARGQRALAGGDRARARAAFEAALEGFPEHAEADGPAEALAMLALESGDTARALSYLARVTGVNDGAGDANRLEAELRIARGDARGALAALERLAWMSPLEALLHARLAETASRAGASARAVRARRVA
ncbi:MAG: tetratricopeptide repeat protein, partial [Gemmatimonadales bacterium]